MQTIDTLVRSVQIIAVIIVVLLAIFGAVGFYFMKIHRSRVQEKHLDYSQFKRLDTLEYVKFDDVGEHMVVADGKKRFIGAIACSGCEFRDAEDEERLQIIRGYLSFINVLDNQNIQFWQMARDVNLDKMVTDYKEQLSSLQERQYLMTLDYEELKKRVRADPGRGRRTVRPVLSETQADAERNHVHGLPRGSAENPGTVSGVRQRRES